jgi:hypothetical protein
MAPTASSYDLFLSYNSADHRIIEEVAHKLADAGLKELFRRALVGDKSIGKRSGTNGGSGARGFDFKLEHLARVGE